jgi:hypothetical protein
MMESLRLPRVHVSQALSRLRSNGLVIPRSTGGSWSLTPAGRHGARALVGAVDLASLEAELLGHPGADLGDVRHSVISPALAPPQWEAPINRLLDRFPFETNVFCMTRFPDSDSDDEYLDPVRDVIDVARTALKEHGLTLHLASDRNVEDELFGNVAGHMWACQYGIALFEDRLERGLNENMLIEVGSMLMTGRRCMLLRDPSAPPMPANFVGRIYKPVDFDDPDQVRGALASWATEDLGLRPNVGASSAS